MIKYFIENIQFYFILLFWTVLGRFGGPLIYLVIPISLVILKQRNKYEELFIGFFYMLILSDNELLKVDFAKNMKIIYLVIVSIFLFLDRKQFNTHNFIFNLFVPFFLVSIYCLIFSESFFVSFQKTLSYILMFILIPNFIMKLYQENGTKSFRSIIFFGTAILIAGYLLFFIHKDYAYNTIIGRYLGIFGNPNGLGLYCFLFFILFFALNDIFDDLFTRNEKIFIYSTILLSTILSNSRNAILSIAILILFDRFFQRSAFLGFLVSVILIVLNFFISDQIPVIIKGLGLERFFRLNTLQELSGRSVAWQFAWKKIQNNFFIGKGFGYDEFTMRANYIKLGKLGTQGGVHSSYLSLWFNFGLIGLLVYMRSIILIFIKSNKNTKLSFSIMYAVFFSAAFEGLFIGSLNPQMIILLILLTIISESELDRIGEMHIETI